MRRSFSSMSAAIKAWIKGECGHGKCRNNLDFNGDIIYSYGHYEIARKLPGKVALINGHGSSSTTERQKSQVNWTLSQAGYTVLYSSEYSPNTDNVSVEHNVNLECYLKQAEGFYARAISARESRNWLIPAAQQRCGVFDTYRRTIAFEVEPRLVAWKEELSARLDAPIPEDQRKALLAAKRKATRAEHIIQAVEYNRRLAEWLTGEGWLPDNNQIPEGRISHVRLVTKPGKLLDLDFTRWNGGMDMSEALAALYAIRHNMVGTKIGNFTLMEVKPDYIWVYHSPWGNPRAGQRGTKMLMSEINAIADKVGA